MYISMYDSEIYPAKDVMLITCFIVQKPISTMLVTQLIWLLLPYALLHAAPLPRLNDEQLSHHASLLSTLVSRNPSITARDSDDDKDDDHKNGISRIIASAASHSSDHWAYLVAKILAGLAGLCALFIIIFFLHRHKVRSRRRRLGEMMGLGRMRNKVLESHAKAKPGRRTGEEQRAKSVGLHSHRWRNGNESRQDSLFAKVNSGCSDQSRV